MAMPLTLMEEWTAGESLRKHGLSVSLCCEAYGRREAERLGLGGESAEVMATEYACTGLLHDFDYERHPYGGGAPVCGRGLPAGAWVA